jgi:hypothetical protein
MDVLWGVMDRREHHRVQLRIPARLRWTTPLGQKTEVCDTLNVCRGGVFVPCKEAHAPGTTLWVTFPYDASVPYGQPEILARVVRSAIADRNGHAANGNGEKVSANGAKTADHGAETANRAYVPAAALRFELAPRPGSNGNGHRRELERRSSARRPLALPVRVRPEHVPWFEETMTLDISAEGLRFLSSREYETGQYLLLAFEPGALSPWPAAAEFRSLVVRVDPVPQSSALAVTVCRVH